MSDFATPGRRQLAMERLGGDLRKVREAAGLSQRAVGEALNCTQGKINKLENGSNRVKLPELEKILQVCRVADGPARALREQAVEIESLPGANQLNVPIWFQKFAKFEPTATEVCSWHTERLPGLLQTEHYMHKQFSVAGYTGTELTRLWRARRSRKEVFELERPPRYRFVLGESSLYRTPDGFSPLVALDEVEYLLALVHRHPAVTVQVMPFTARIPFVHSDFTLMRFPQPQPDFVYLEHAAGGTQIKSEADIRQFNEAWDAVVAAALNPADTVRFLELAKRHFQKLSTAEAADAYRRPTVPFMIDPTVSSAPTRDNPF